MHNPAAIVTAIRIRIRNSFFIVNNCADLFKNLPFGNFRRFAKGLNITCSNQKQASGGIK